VQGIFDSCWVEADGTVAYRCGSCGVGRLPNDTKPCPLGETLAERLARQAYYEGASVVAFERLADVLAANGAPDDLVARARLAAEDEARHAAIFADLSRARGASAPAIELAAAAPSLFDLAIENATEGCVRETFGAAITLHQAMHAEADDVRAAFAAICDDEAEHASSSWDLWAWLLFRCRED
jgi:phage gp29-like protein